MLHLLVLLPQQQPTILAVSPASPIQADNIVYLVSLHPTTMLQVQAYPALQPNIILTASTVGTPAAVVVAE